MVRGEHTQEGSRNTPLALLTGHFHFNTHTISVRDETTSLTGISYSSLFPSDWDPLSLIIPRELLVPFCQSQLEAPVSSNHQEPGRLQEEERKQRRRGERGEFRSHCL